MSDCVTRPLKLHLFRHGETAWALSGRHTGRTDIPLTARGEAEARALGSGLGGIPFRRVFSSPLQRARRTCALVALPPPVELEPDLAEWDYGDYEGKRRAEILGERPGWSVFHDGAPRGESPAQIGARADRLIARLRLLEGDIALFTHGHFGRVLAARWIGLSVGESSPFLLRTASHSILGHDHEQTGEPAIELWNAPAPEPQLPPPGADTQAALATQKMRSLDRWENEGGEIPLVHPPVAARPPGAAPALAKRLFVFGQDRTLAESKAPVDDEVAALGQLAPRSEKAIEVFLARGPVPVGASGAVGQEPTWPRLLSRTRT